MRYAKHRQDTEDILQESYIKIFKDLKQFDSNRGLYKFWSNHIVINTCLHFLGKRKYTIDLDQHVENEKVEFNTEALSSLNLQDMTRLIAGLPRGYRTVFNMYVIDGFSHKEIATMLQVSTSTSKTQLMKAKKLLQEKLEASDLRQTGVYA